MGTTNINFKNNDVAIGDTIEIEGKTYKCVKSCETEVCDNCALFCTSDGCSYVCCGEFERADKTDVHFELVYTEKEECTKKVEDDENKSKESTQIKVGEVGFLDGKKVRCNIAIGRIGICARCAFSDKEYCTGVPCVSGERHDGLNVYYEEVVDAVKGADDN